MLVLKKSIWILILFTIFSHQLYSQSSDFDLLKDYFKPPTASFDSTINIKKQTTLFDIFPGPLFVLYKQLISKQFSANCRFNPGCSSFSVSLIREYGIFKGVFLSADRLTRCNLLAAPDTPGFLIHLSDGKIHETTQVYKWKEE